MKRALRVKVMKDEIIKILKEKNDYVSGEEIGNILGVSRAAVWKNISALKKKGYNIISVNNKGYKIVDDTDVLNVDEIKYDRLLFKEEVESTNEEGKRQAVKENCDRLLVTCNYQSKGKGRIGRSWVAEKNRGVYMSFVLKPDIMPQEISQITLVAGIAVMKAINSLTGLKTKIKWPNDIIINGKKLVGILSEMSAEMEKINYVVVGIGINVNEDEFEGELKEKATSIYIETKRRFKRSDVINSVAEEFNLCYDKFLEKGFSAFVEEYNESCANVGMRVKTVGGREEIKGRAMGVNEKGELVIDDEGEMKTVIGGEVSLRLENNKYI